MTAHAPRCFVSAIPGLPRLATVGLLCSISLQLKVDAVAPFIIGYNSNGVKAREQKIPFSEYADTTLKAFASHLSTELNCLD